MVWHGFGILRPWQSPQWHVARWQCCLWRILPEILLASLCHTQALNSNSLSVALHVCAVNHECTVKQHLCEHLRHMRLACGDALKVILAWPRTEVLFVLVGKDKAPRVVSLSLGSSTWVGNFARQSLCPLARQDVMQVCSNWPVSRATLKSLALSVQLRVAAEAFVHKVSDSKGNSF